MLRLFRITDREYLDFERRAQICTDKNLYSLDRGEASRVLISCERSKRSVRVGELFNMGSELFALLSSQESITLLHDAQGFTPKISTRITNSPAVFLFATLKHAACRLLRASPRMDENRSSRSTQSGLLKFALHALYAFIVCISAAPLAEAPERDATTSAEERLYRLTKDLLNAPASDESPPSPTSTSLSNPEPRPVEVTSNVIRKTTQQIRSKCNEIAPEIPSEALAFLSDSSLEKHQKPRGGLCNEKRY